MKLFGVIFSLLLLLGINDAYGAIFNIVNFGAKGDGITDNSSAINKAIDQAYSAGGGVVVIPKAARPFLFTQINMKTNVELRGDGGILEFKKYVAINKNRKYYPINNLGHSNSSFINLIVLGNGNFNRQFSVCDMITCVGENSKVIGCKIMDSPDSGIMISNTLNGVCRSNYISNGSDCGIYVNALKNGANKGTIVEDNHIENFVITGIALKRQSNTVIVRNNEIINCGTGISLEDFTKYGFGYPRNIKILNNKLTKIGLSNKKGISKVGIIVSKGSFIEISGNILKDCNGIGIHCSRGNNFIISNNTILTSGKQSIFLRGTATKFQIYDNISNKNLHIGSGNTAVKAYNNKM